jgi:PilZ domain
VTGYSDEPAILDRVTLETMSGTEWLSHGATIANLTPQEVWLNLEQPLGKMVDPESTVRIVTSRDGEPLTAETTIGRSVGADGLVIVLVRPESWGLPSRRANTRARLAIPALLRPSGDLSPVAARTTNIGAGGFHCVSDIPIAVGYKVPVTLYLTPLDPFECQAQVVRLDADPDDPSGRHFVVAFRFLDLTEDDEATIAKTLVALSGENDSEVLPRAWRSAGSAVTSGE